MSNERAHTPLLPVYLICGSDALKRTAVRERLEKRIFSSNDASLAANEFDGESASGADIVAVCNTHPFLTDLRLVIVDNAERISNKDSETLISYIQNPCDTTVLALIADKLPKNSRLYKTVFALGNHAVIDCSAQKSFDLVRLVCSLASGHGLVFTDSAAKKLIELVGEDTVRLDAEIKKISLAGLGQDSVKNEDIVSVVARSAEVKPWKLLDALSDRDMAACSALFFRMDSVSPYALVGMCAARIRELICARSLILRGDEALIAETLGLPAWRVKNHPRWAFNFTGEELRRALVALRDTEQRMKSGTDPKEALLTWMVDVVSGSGLRAI